MRRALALSVLFAACSTPIASPDTGRDVPTEFPNGAARWRLERYQDERGAIPPRAWQTALQQREATIAAVAALPDQGGVGPLAWRHRGPDNVAGRTRAIAIDPTNPQRIWVGAVSGGLWKSENGGASWTLVDDWWRNLSVGSLALDPTNPQTIYLGTGEGHWSLGHLVRSVAHFVRGAGMMKSVDGGATWTHLTATDAWQHVTRIAVSQANPNVLLASRRPGGIARSTDGGLTWTDVTNGLVADPFSYQVVFDPNDANKAVAHLAPGSVATHHVIRSTDGGQTWQFAQTGLASVAGEGSRIELCYAPSAPGMVYAATGFGGGKVWRSTDGGANWTQQTQATQNLGQSYYYCPIWVDPTNSDLVVTASINPWRSVDGGVTFTQIGSGYIMTQAPHSDCHAIAPAPGYDGATNRRVYFATDGGLHATDDVTTVSTNGGWQDLDATMRSTQFYAAAGHLTNDVVLGGTQDNGTLRVLGNSPTANLVFGGDGGQVQIDPTNPQFTYGEYQYLGVHRSSNGGASAQQITSGLLDVGAGKSNFIAPLRLDPNDPNRLYAGGRSLWRTDSARSNTTWTAVKPDVGSLIASIAVTPGNANRVYTGHNDGRLYRSDDATTAAPTWTALDDNAGSNPLPGRVLIRLVHQPGNPQVMYACFGGFAADNLWRSTDAGATWQSVVGTAPLRLPVAPVYGLAVHPDDPNVLYAATEVGVFASEDGGQTWATSNDGPANVVCEEITFAHGTGPRRLVLATLGRGLWTADVARPTAVPYGSACAGATNPPTLGVDPMAPASVGTTMQFVAGSLPAGQPFSWLLLGVSNTAWNGTPLPLPLDAIGMTGCALQASVEASPTAPVTGTTAQWPLPLPANPLLLGFAVYAQAMALAPGANAAGLTLSRPLAVTVGW
jgi:hypothetical protein